MSIRKIIFCILLLSTGIMSFAQYQERGKSFDYLDAETFFKSKNYFDALPLYQKLRTSHPKVYEYKFKLAVCNIELDLADEKTIELLTELESKKNITENLFFYIGKYYFIHYDYEKATEYFNKAKESKYTSLEKKPEIPSYLNYCTNGKVLIKDTINVNIINLGPTINTFGNEYSPLINADETQLFFTYRGEKSTGGRQNEFNEPIVNGNFYEDIFISTKIGDVWQSPISLGEHINTNMHEASVSLSPDGNTMFLYKDTKETAGDIFVTQKVNQTWSEPEKLPINSDSWEGSASMAPDGSFIIFSSDRPGGFGGKDLYITYKNNDTSYTEPKNLGKEINTELDEDAPFIRSDGKSFNFSSKGHNSMGGYDIFESKINTDSSCFFPRNIGYPINTSSDDIFFYISGKGNAYYSSIRTEGYGQQDLYMMDARQIISSNPVLLVKGIIKENGAFIKAKINVKTSSDKNLGTYYSSEQDGKYQFYIDINDYYVITYEKEGYVSKIKSVDATNIKEYTEINHNVNFISGDLTVEGIAYAKNNQNLPLANFKIQLMNKDSSVDLIDTTDINGKYHFDNLPKDDYFLLFLNDDDQQRINDSTIVLKGSIKFKTLPYSDAYLNEIKADDQGRYLIEYRNKYYFSKLKKDDFGLQEILVDDISLFDRLIKKYGDKKVNGLAFKVQIGAYKNKSNFETKRYNSIGKIKTEQTSEGITKFLVGNEQTLNQAEVIRKKAIARGISDAFIIVYFNGTRIFLEDLSKQKIFE